MISLGLDIGYDRCGFAFIDLETEKLLDSGVIITDKKLSIQRRLKILRDDLCIIKKKFKPELVCIEKLFFNRKNLVFEKICMSKGVALELFCESKVIEVEPKKAKKEVLGSGNVTKSEVKDTLGMFMKIDFSKYLDDEVDAIYLALYAAKLEQFEKLYNKK